MAFFLGHFYEFHNFMIQIHGRETNGRMNEIINSQTDIKSAQKSRTLVTIQKRSTQSKIDLRAKKTK